MAGIAKSHTLTVRRPGQVPLVHLGNQARPAAGLDYRTVRLGTTSRNAIRAPCLDGTALLL